MNKLVEEIIKPILEANSNIKKVVGIYGGRFQPFGPHHYKTYKWLTKQVDEAYITTSNIKKPPRHPMNFKEKVRHMSKMGVPSNRIIEEKSPYVAKNLAKKYDKDTTAFVYVFGAKDAGRLGGGGKYFQDYKKSKGDIKGFEENGYYLVAPHVSISVGGKEVSGTTMRELLGSDKFDDKQRAKLFKKMFGYYDKGVFQMMSNKFKKLFESADMEFKPTSMYYTPSKKKKLQKKFKDGKKKELIQDKSLEKLIRNLKIPQKLMKGNKQKLINYLTSNPQVVTQLIRLATEGKLNENVTPSQLSQVEKYLDKLWGKVGIDVEFTRHFIDRVNDNRNEKPINSAEVLRLFKQTYKKYGKQIPKLGKGAQALMKDMRTDVNVPFALHWNGKELELRAKTIMRKKNFKSSNKKFAVEGVDLPIKVGDTVKMGKFKNKKVVIKSIEWNEKGDLLINGKSAMRFRILKTEQIINFLINRDVNKILQEGSSGSGQSMTDDGPRYWWGDKKSYINRQNKLAQQLGFEIVDEIMKNDSMWGNYNAKETDYPNGPTGAVSYYPAGSVDSRAGTNVFGDTKGTTAYNLWSKHIENISQTLGNEIINYLGAEKSIESSEKEAMKPGDKGDESAKKETPSRDSDDQHDDLESVKESFSKKWWKENLLLEGGAYGHMAHPFDDKDLTFGDLKKIIELGLGGTLNREDNVTEKLDGQNIMISWKDGKLIAARNKGHIKNGGKTALTTKGIKLKFAGRGDIADAFNFAMKDLERAIKGLSQKQKDKIFNNGYNFMNMEVMWPKSANVIDYDVATLVFHGALKYDDSGKVVGEVKGSGRILQGMIQQINQHIGKKYSIGKPNFLTVPKHQDFGKMKDKFLGRLSKLRAQYGLKDSDTLGLYHQMWWEVFISGKFGGKNLSGKLVQGLTKRWAFFDKSYSVADIKKDMKRFIEANPKKKNITQEILDFDKKNHAAQVKENMKPFEVLFFEVGAEILKNVKGYIAASPDKAVQGMKKRIDKAISDVKKGGDLKKLNTLKLQLDKLNAIGGIKSIVPSEGIVFKYKGNTYKFTGAFAPVNQIAGLINF